MRRSRSSRPTSGSSKALTGGGRVLLNSGGKLAHPRSDRGIEQRHAFADIGGESNPVGTSAPSACAMRKTFDGRVRVHQFNPTIN
jgi:hypothetical protein